MNKLDFRPRNMYAPLPDVNALFQKYNKVTDKEEKNFYHNNKIVVNEGISIRHNSVFDVLQRLDLREKKVVDLGCGTGHIVNWLIETAKAKATGYDLSCDHIEHGKKLYPELPVFCKSLYNVAATSYDLVILTDVIEHLRISDHVKLVAKLQELSAVGSYIYVNHPSATAVYGLHSQIIDNPLSIQYLVKLFDEGGFKLQFLHHWHKDYFHVLFMRDSSLD